MRTKMSTAVLQYMFNPPGGSLLWRHLCIPENCRCLSYIFMVFTTNHMIYCSDHMISREIQNVDSFSKSVMLSSFGIVVLFSKQRHSYHWYCVVQSLKLPIGSTVSDKELCFRVTEQVLLR